MATDNTTKRLAELVTDVLELGSGKYERDVADDLFDAFGVNLDELHKGMPRRRSKTAFPKAAAAALAAAAPSPEALMTEVVRCGGRFVAMVEEIYSLLADHVATTTGSAEHFRLRRDDVNLEITISPAFIERVRELQSVIRRVTIGRIDHKAIADLVGWDNGEFYGLWPLQRGNLRLLDAVLRTDALGPARLAAEAFVATVQSLLDAHIANLTALNGDDVHTLFVNLDANAEHSARRELVLFRAESVLGATTYQGSVAELDQPTFLGLDRAGGVFMRPVKDLLYGSAMSGLAQFLAMWRSGMRPARGEPRAPEEVGRACEEATAWLRDAVLVPTGSMDAEELIERFEEFLNLPLWRGRELVYEVWILCATLQTCRDLGWNTDLRTLASTDDEWVLDTKPTAEPVASLRHRRDETIALEVWREPRRQTAHREVTPDVAIATPGEHPRDLVVVEAKDRYGMRVGRAQNDRNALGVAMKYRDALHPNATWVCNHCDFREGDADPATNYGDAWSRVHVAAPFRPGSVPAAFAESLDAALTPPGGLRAPAVERLTLAVDVTSSISGRLPHAWALLRDLDQPRYAEFRAVLYSDHGAGEPFITCDLGPCSTLHELLQRIEAEPTGHGSDPEEALEDAMRRCRELAEELGPLTVLVLTDAPPHPVEQCPLGIDFDAEVDALLETGSRCLVCNDWRSATDASWRSFSGRPGFEEASLSELVEVLNA